MKLVIDIDDSIKSVIDKNGTYEIICENAEKYETILEAWKNAEAELKAYAEKLERMSGGYDSKAEGIWHCLNVMRKNLEV